MKKYFESRAKKNFNPSWSHGRYVDYWSFVHLLTGAIFGMIAMLISLPATISFVAILVGLCLYEGAEILAGVSEDIENVLSDIVIGSVGAAITIFLLPHLASKQDMFGLLTLCITLNLLCISAGWKRYLQRKASRGKSYARTLYALYITYICGILVGAISLFYWLH